jgi:hypothetical protein
LATLGFVAEVLGVGLIVFDIRDSRRQARRIVGRAVTLHVDSVVQEQRVSTIQLGGGRQPSLDERVDALERRYRELDRRLLDGLSAMRRELRADARNRARQIEEIIQADYAVLQDVLLDMLAGSLGRRMWGVVLVIIGVAASWAANLVSALAAA